MRNVRGKPKLLDAVKAEKGKVEFLYIDVDAHQGIAQMLQVSSNYQKALT